MGQWLGRYATARSALQFIFMKGGKIARQKKTMKKKKFQGFASEIAKIESKEIQSFREKGPGGRTCNPAATQAFKDLSSKSNFLANRGTAEKSTVISNLRKNRGKIHSYVVNRASLKLMHSSHENYRFSEEQITFM